MTVHTAEPVELVSTLATYQTPCSLVEIVQWEREVWLNVYHTEGLGTRPVEV